MNLKDSLAAVDTLFGDFVELYGVAVQEGIAQFHSLIAIIG